MKTKINIFLVALLLVFMQYSLFQHELSHTFSDHDDHEHEIAQQCELCLGANTLNQYIFTAKLNISLESITLVIICIYHFIASYSQTIKLPPSRAPPIQTLFN